jgi:arachidonate 5-lipoxygenase
MFFLVLKVCFAFFLKVFRDRGRATHRIGVSAKGRLRIVDAPAFPPHEFFEPGREFDCQVRHASVAFVDDDAAKDIRGASIKLSLERENAPLDILMNTGEQTFLSAAHFWKFALAQVSGRKPDEPVSASGMKEFVQADELNFFLYASALRRAPSSFSRLYYHSQLVNHFRAKDGKERYVKYRLVPEDAGAEQGIATDDDAKTPWIQKRLPDETRAPDYLRKEFLERVAEKGVVYHLQLRLHGPEDPAGIFTQAKPWDQETSPWLDLATIRLSQPNPQEWTEKLRFTIARQPSTLGLVESKDIHHPNSVNYVRAHVYRKVQKVRSLLYFLRGPGAWGR